MSSTDILFLILLGIGMLMTWGAALYGAFSVLPSVRSNQGSFDVAVDDFGRMAIALCVGLCGSGLISAVSFAGAVG
jgi:hypothetical protein